MPTGNVGWEGFAPKLEHGAGNPEALKYGKMWELEQYRKDSAGEQLAGMFLQIARPKAGAEVLDLGCGTGRGGLVLAVVGNLRVTFVDFVRNCLDADIVPMLEAQAHVMRFVKADLEKPLPVAGEYGFCCDVMEHIPPDRVDATLNNILRAAEHVFFSISTVDDNCGTLIGETLHLTVRSFEWWTEQFEKRQCRVHWSKKVDGAALFYVTAWAKGGDFIKAGALNVKEQEAIANVRVNTAPAKGYQQVMPSETTDLEVVVLGGGPSVEFYEERIRALRDGGAKIITLNGAYGWALARGLGPVNQIMVDARAFNARFVDPPREDCLYLIASQCHPSVLEKLPKDRVFLWHTSAEMIRDVLLDNYGTRHWRLKSPEGKWMHQNGRLAVFSAQEDAQLMLSRMVDAPEGAEVVELGREDAEPWFGIPGGSTVLLRAIPLLRMLGFRKFHLFGCDSCLSGDAHHAYTQPENDGAMVLAVTCGGRMFKCHPWMVSQAEEFMDLVRGYGDEIELEIYGDGLLAHIVETGAKLQTETEERTALLAEAMTAATGKPHYYGRLFEDTGDCAWCGKPRVHEWHLAGGPKGDGAC